jgi:chaperone modulatory protein CbpM
MRDETVTVIHGEVLEEIVELTLAELCRTCGLPAHRMIEMVDEGIITPIGRDPGRWRFRGVDLRRVWRVQRLQRDLGLNLAGAAIALDLLDELERLRALLRRLGIHPEGGDRG